MWNTSTGHPYQSSYSSSDWNTKTVHCWLHTLRDTWDLGTTRIRARGLTVRLCWGQLERLKPSNKIFQDWLELAEGDHGFCFSIFFIIFKPRLWVNICYLFLPALPIKFSIYLLSTLIFASLVQMTSPKLNGISSPKDSDLLGFWTLFIVRILNTRRHNVSETGPVSILKWEGETPTLLGSLERG
jgi:hypothetical protein